MFVQVVTLKTTRIDEVRKIDEEWRRATAGRSTLLRERIFADRNQPNTYVAVCEFASYEDAVVNSELPETTECAAALAALCDEPPTFTDLDFVEEIVAERVA